MQANKILLFLILLPSTAFATNYCNDASIVACYMFNQGAGSTLLDVSSNANNCTMGAGATWQSSNLPSRKYITFTGNFNGSTSKTDCGTAAGLLSVNGSSFSAIGWFYLA